MNSHEEVKNSLSQGFSNFFACCSGSGAGFRSGSVPIITDRILGVQKHTDSTDTGSGKLLLVVK
jgi:hypothetical protein